MHVADALSRVQSPFDDDPEEKIHYEVLNINPISPSKYTESVEVSGNYVILSQLAHVVNNGNWPARFQGCQEWMKPFFCVSWWALRWQWHRVTRNKNNRPRSVTAWVHATIAQEPHVSRLNLEVSPWSFLLAKNDWWYPPSCRQMWAV